MRKAVSTALASVLALGVAGMSGSALAQDVAGVYKDHTVTILVGYGAGGTYGRTSLLLSEHLGKYVPGNPSVVVQHMPGAGGLKAANYFYNVAPKHGHNLLMPPEMTIASELLRPKKVKYKSKDFTWLGRVFGLNSTLVVRRDSGVTKVEDLKNRSIVVSSSGKGSPTYLVPAALNALFGAKLKIVTGYSGSRKAQLAVEQREVDGLSVGWTVWISAKPDWFKGGDKSYALPLVQNGFKPRKEIAHVPMLRSLIKDKKDLAVANILASASLIGRGLVLPPGAPTELVEPLRSAFDKTVADAKFVEGAKRRGLQVDPSTGADVQQIVDELMATPMDQVKRARKIIFGDVKS
jgi:tripartite-type tricarboxylate transporter receptor subunit TctC